MALPAPNLDDRTFQDIVDEAKRLIPRYTPEWTNHNLSDPGVALIELFAWMSEMVLFRVNQVPDRLFVHFLNLVGIEPFPPSVARADITFWLSAAQERTVVGAGRHAGDDRAGDCGRAAGRVHHRQPARHRPPELTAAITTDAKIASGSPTSPTTCGTRARRSTASAPSTRPVGWCPATRCCWASPDRWPVSRSGCRSLRRAGDRRRSAAAAAGVGGVERRGLDRRRRLLRHHRRSQPVRRDRADGAERARAADAGERRRVLDPGPADHPATGPTDVPGLADDRRSAGRDHRRHGAGRTCLELAGRGARPIGRQPRAGVPGDLPAGAAAADGRDGPGHRCRRLGGMDRGGGLLAVRRRPTTTSSGTPRPAWSGSVRGSGTPTGRCGSTAGSRATARRSRSPATGTAVASAGNVGARTLTALRSSVPVHLRVRQPARRHRRGGRGNRCGGEGSRSADPAHRPAGRHRRRFRAADPGVVDRGRPGPLPAVGDRVGVRSGCWWYRRCAPTRGTHVLDDFALAAPLMRRITEHLDAHRHRRHRRRGGNAVLPGGLGRGPGARATRTAGCAGPATGRSTS